MSRHLRVVGAPGTSRVLVDQLTMEHVGRVVAVRRHRAVICGPLVFAPTRSAADPALAVLRIELHPSQVTLTAPWAEEVWLLTDRVTITVTPHRKDTT